MNDKSQGSFFSIGIVRGVIGLIMGMIAGIALVSVVRLISGLPVWSWGPESNHFGFYESAWVAGAIFGFVRIYAQHRSIERLAVLDARQGDP